MPLPNDLTLSLESTSFPCDRLHVRRLSGGEAISRLFDLELEIVCLDHDGPPAESMTGAPDTLVIEGAEGSGWQGTRRVHGVITSVEDMLAAHADVRVYLLRLAPRASALTMIETPDVFLDASVPQIVMAKLGAAALDADTEMRLVGAYSPREFVVQYRESDYALLCRLTEHLGISFFFEQTEDREKLVFTDHNGGFAQLEDARSIPFRPGGEERDVFALRVKHSPVPAYYAMLDYNYRSPQLNLTVEHELAGGSAGGVVEYGAHYKTPEEGKALARVRAEERQAGRVVYTGKSAVPALAAGMRFTLEGHPDLGSIDLLVTDVQHHAVQAVPGMTHAAGEALGYSNTFHAIPADFPYRPPRVTPRPRINGLITGIVDAGPAGPEAHYAPIDEQGRYLIRFSFDTSAPGERPASRPVRMLQNHAGENFGTHFPLKAGVEVAIGFIDGDPDRPLIVGAVPNPTKPSPVTAATPGLHRIRTSRGIKIDIME